MADALVCGDKKAVYADKGYESKERRKRLKARGVKDRIMHRSHKHQSALPHWQRLRDKLIAPLRAPVEAPFGSFKRRHGRSRARYCRFGHYLADFFRLASSPFRRGLQRERDFYSRM